MELSANTIRRLQVVLNESYGLELSKDKAKIAGISIMRICLAKMQRALRAEDREA